ncbi:MAG: DUF6804 family protein [Chitinophagales bacterium]
MISIRRVMLITGILLLLGMLKLPIGYYTFLRIIVFGVSIYTVYQTHQQVNKIDFWVAFFGLTAVLFNPIIPIYLNDKKIWAVIDGVCGSIFILSYFILKFPQEE